MALAFSPHDRSATFQVHDHIATQAGRGLFHPPSSHIDTATFLTRHSDPVASGTLPDPSPSPSPHVPRCLMMPGYKRGVTSMNCDGTPYGSALSVAYIPRQWHRHPASTTV